MKRASKIANKVLAIADEREPVMSRLQFSSRCKHVAGEWKGFPYDPNSDPIQHWIFEQLDMTKPDGSRLWERFYWCAAPQFAGKTICGVIIPLLHAITQDRLPVGFAMPTLQSIDKSWATKLRPQIVASGFGEYLPESGPGSQGGRGSSIQFRHPKTGGQLGQLLFCTPGAFADTTAVMLADDVDQFRHNSKPDLDGLEDLWNRCNAYRGRALRIAVGTVEWDVDSTVLALVAQGTGSRPWLQCPHCNRMQLLDPERQLIYEGDSDDEVRASARLVCVHCATHWSEQDRQVAIKHMQMVHQGQTIADDGSTVGDMPRTIALSVLEDAFSCPHSRLPELAREDWLSKKAEAKGSFAPRRKYVRYRLCKTYQQPAAQGELTNRGLAEVSKRSNYHRGEVPGFVRFLTAGCDVQKDRHYFCVLGHGYDGEFCIIDWGYDYLKTDAEGKPVPGHEPTERERVAVLDRTARRMDQGWPRQGHPEEVLLPVWCAIDVGYQGGVIVPFVSSRQGWACAKGVGRNAEGRLDTHAEGTSLFAEHPELGERCRGILDISQPATMTCKLFRVFGNSIRSQLQSALLRAPNSAGAGALPMGLAQSDYLLLHLTSEIMTPHPKTGAPYLRQVRTSNHLLDSAIYALAMGLFYSEYIKVYPTEQAPMQSSAIADQPMQPIASPAAPEDPRGPPPPGLTWPDPNAPKEGADPWQRDRRGGTRRHSLQDGRRHSFADRDRDRGMP